MSQVSIMNSRIGRTLRKSLAGLGVVGASAFVAIPLDGCQGAIDGIPEQIGESSSTRIHYFDGRFLDARDLQDEQTY